MPFKLTRHERFTLSIVLFLLALGFLGVLIL